MTINMRLSWSLYATKPRPQSAGGAGTARTTASGADAGCAVLPLLGPTFCPVQEELLVVLLGVVVSLFAHVGLQGFAGEILHARHRDGRAEGLGQQVALGVISALGVIAGGRVRIGRLGGGPVPDVAAQVGVHQEGHEQESDDGPQPHDGDQRR